MELAVHLATMSSTYRSPSIWPARSRVDWAQELEASSAYFRARAGTHSKVFDGRTGFYSGRVPDGGFRLEPDEYDPVIWGYDSAETTGWGSAFTAPHDGAGLAALHGGRAALATKLEEFLATPESGDESVRGSYPEVIHEMREARNQRLGQLALSNQPAHHIPFIPLFAGRPDMAQDLVRTAVERLFTGGEIGQGWPGDEDNGEMGAWWIFASLGLYPLVPGTAGYVLVAPSFRRARLRLGDGAIVTLEAPLADRAHRYIRGVLVDGEEWSSTFLPHEILAKGARITFELADTPQDWGTTAEAEPPSLTEASHLPTVLRDLSPQGRRHATAGDSTTVFDDDARGDGLACAAGDSVVMDFDSPVTPSFLTVTSRDPGAQAFRLEGRGIDGVWHPVGTWHAVFEWERQLRPFLLDTQAFASWRWLAETHMHLLQLELSVVEEAIVHRASDGVNS